MRSGSRGGATGARELNVKLVFGSDRDGLDQDCENHRHMEVLDVQEMKPERGRGTVDLWTKGR